MFKNISLIIHVRVHDILVPRPVYCCTPVHVPTVYILVHTFTWVSVEFIKLNLNVFYHHGKKKYMYMYVLFVTSYNVTTGYSRVQL